MAWSVGPALTLTPPPGAGWTAHLDLQLRMSDGARSAWTEEVPVSDQSVEHTVVLPPEVTHRGLGLLVARVWFEAADGRETQSLGLAGQFVEATASGLRATTQQFSAVMGAGLIVDEHDGMDLDEEVIQ